MKKSEALKTLGLQEGATEEDIKKAHRKLIIANHPDKFGTDEAARAQAEEKTQLINEARDVLLNHSWDPEYSTSGTPYGAPFSYNPYASSRPQGGQAPQGNPFEGCPFGASPFSWADPFAASGSSRSGGSPNISNDASGNSQGSRQGRGSYSGSNPFAGTVFDFGSFFTNEPTAEELLHEAKADLRQDVELIVAKAVILALTFLLTAPATGLYLYTIISIGQGIWKRLNFLSLFLLVPFAMLALIFTPGGDAAIGVIALVVFACAVGFDISNVYRHVKTIRALKKD